MCSLSEFIHKAVEQEGMPDCDDMVTLALAKELECHFVSNDQYRDFQVRRLHQQRMGGGGSVGCGSSAAVPFRLSTGSLRSMAG